MMYAVVLDEKDAQPSVIERIQIFEGTIGTYGGYEDCVEE